jgi:hypothetical protein
MSAFNIATTALAALGLVIGSGRIPLAQVPADKSVAALDVNHDCWTEAVPYLDREGRAWLRGDASCTDPCGYGRYMHVVRTRSGLVVNLTYFANEAKARELPPDEIERIEEAVGRKPLPVARVVERQEITNLFILVGLSPGTLRMPASACRRNRQAACKPAAGLLEELQGPSQPSRSRPAGAGICGKRAQVAEHGVERPLGVLGQVAM